MSREVLTMPESPRGGMEDDRARLACLCRACYGGELPLMMIVCATCGNKRCPHATDHRNSCTASNAPGQSGSDYA